jgi:hypothetical protein
MAQKQEDDKLKLIPLDDLKKVVAQIAKLPKAAVEGVMPKPQARPEKRPSTGRQE